MKDYIIVSLSAFTVAFTLFSFWRMYYRRGQIKVLGVPRSYYRLQSVTDDDATVVLGLPLIFYNTGAVPLLVQNLRLDLTAPLVSHPWRFLFTARLSEISFRMDQTRYLPSQFAILPRQPTAIACEFQAKNVPVKDLPMNPLSFNAIITGSVNGSWKQLSGFILRLSVNDGVLFDNDPSTRDGGREDLR